MAKKTLKDRLKEEAERIKKQEEERGAKFEKIETFKPVVGNNLIRILPNQKDPDMDFFKRVALHFIPYKKKDGSAVEIPARCLNDLGEDCPFCAENERLFREGDKDGAKKFRALERFVYLIVDYSKKEIVPYVAGSNVHAEIIKWCEDINPLEHDWTLTKKYDAAKGKQFGTSYSIRPSIKPTDLPTKITAMLEDEENPVVDIDKLYASNELEKMNEYLGLDEERPAPKKKVEEKKTETKKFAGKSKPKMDDDDDPRFSGKSDEEEDEFPEDRHAKKKLAEKKAKTIDEDEEEEENEDLGDFESEDDDLNEELRRMGVE